ncbi:MAG: hypothetical protein IT437_09930 [Phycisphaerales bacterium]|nr:hypothetical protein [Phycisphaerales bacterium]
MAAVALVAGAAVVPAQQTPPPAAPAVALPVIEQYLAARGLKELLAAHLLHELRQAPGDARMGIAERLGKVYVELLDAAATPEAREKWRQRSVELLQAVPEADSFDLRINLTRVPYRRAEDIAEAARLRLATPEEVQEALGILRTSGATFRDIGLKVHRRVDALERRESSARDDLPADAQAALADARRLRSLAMYYAGWSHYYLAFLEDKPQPVEDALAEFGWIVGGGDAKPASVERLSANLLRFPHVARAAIACAMCESLRGNDNTALRWLDAVQQAEDLPPEIAEQLVPRRLDVLCRARRWADCELLVRRTRNAAKNQTLPVGIARLLAVLTLDALEQDRVLPLARDTVQKLSDLAVTDLIALGEVRQVLDLASRYGTATLSKDGFIPNYVRGLQAYDRARKAHAQSGANVEEPSAEDAVRNAYAQAADTLAVAVADPEAARFAGEAANAGLVMGLSRFYAGDLVLAADQFDRVFRASTDAKQRDEALWLATVALDKAVAGGKPSLKERLDSTATLYLKTFPTSVRAAQLLIRLSGSSLLSEEDAVTVLMGVPRDSAVYEAARRQAATLLYVVYRRSRGPAKDAAAIRFADLAEEAIGFDRARIEDKDEAVSHEATRNLVTRVRQVLDATLGMSVPDLERADRVLGLLDAAAAYRSLDLSAVKDELTFRRLQVALARGDTKAVTRHLDELYAVGGRFADAAARILYKRASASWSPGDPASAREVVRHGLIVVGQFRTDAKTVLDPPVYSLYNTVAEAAAQLWDADHDAAMRDAALRLDRTLRAAGASTASVLGRLARLSESAGDIPTALDSWRSLLRGLPEGGAAWYEARYQSLRLLAIGDPVRAREAMDQHKLLHPDMGPEPWGSRLRELDAAIPAAPPAKPTPPEPGTTSASTDGSAR